jgi:hypothetical protein
MRYCGCQASAACRLRSRHCWLAVWPLSRCWAALDRARVRPRSFPPPATGQSFGGGHGIGSLQTPTTWCIQCMLPLLAGQPTALANPNAESAAAILQRKASGSGPELSLTGLSQQAVSAHSHRAFRLLFSSLGEPAPSQPSTSLLSFTFFRSGHAEAGTLRPAFTIQGKTTT